ncbi:MAG: TIR domain-containing protein [Candidatus Komeilibacteria bacterium]|nr:TIR domain-containing protein [Candidatus Komeilibacteria bacterium]
MPKRQVFYSFHYTPDCWRASTVRNIGVIEGNRPAPDNDWETITRGGENAIKKWIDEQMKYRSCTLVLIGSNTANRKWINYEIVKSWDDGMGIAGIYINGLKNSLGYVSTKGQNPFDYIMYGKTGKRLSSIVKCYDPSGLNSKLRYDWIAKYIAAIADEAVKVRKAN